MSQRAVCNNVHNIIKPSKRTRIALPVHSASPSTWSRRNSFVPSISPSRALSRAPTNAECRASISTPSTRRSFASSSRSNGWAPARTLDRSHPAAPTDADKVVQHLQQLFPSLEFPEDLALRIITHASWRNGEEGHNGRMAFLGRRVLECYLNLFLHSRTNSGISTPHVFHRMDYDELAAKILDTPVLGEYVGSAWNLEQVMRWVPSHTNDPSRTMWSSGLYRVRGTAVEAIVGGVFHQFGGLVAHRLFHTRLLPHLAAASILPISDSLRQAVTDASKAYGGLEAPLIRSPEKEAVSP
ncbi:hypothetical protein M408DRAFT_325550 [Serendipita vermifera MAFF 305830]|uniref:RNase III domain-containing protein n=1 Tax=Serendipita vermifera MAFF 305830 TaxID=933852 RepID=A0A0C2XYS5_SERVB|nr:hypothetical protein M408DRAFT_325550 [Serendipita vermifera MAFF 305830]